MVTIYENNDYNVEDKTMSKTTKPIKTGDTEGYEYSGETIKETRDSWGQLRMQRLTHNMEKLDITTVCPLLKEEPGNSKELVLMPLFHYGWNGLELVGSDPFCRVSIT